MRERTRTIGRGLAGGLALAAFLAVTPAHAYQIADGLELNGLFFGDASYSDNDAKSGFHNKRNYVTLKAVLRPDADFRLTLDQSDEAGKVFVKYAYVEKRFTNGMAVQAGQVVTPMAPWDNGSFWGYRFVEQCFTQYWGALTTADLGASLKGKLAKDQVFYHVALLNGEGFQNTADGNGFAIAGQVGAETKGVHVGGYFHEERDRAGVNHYNPSREGLYGFWEDEPYFRVGGQVMIVDDGPAAGTGAGAAAGAKFDSGRGWNVQGRVKLPAKQRDVWAFGRYDQIKEGNTGHKFLAIAGFSTEMWPGLTVAPNVRLEDTGSAATGNDFTAAIHAQLAL
jgi:hypothetical protein